MNHLKKIYFFIFMFVISSSALGLETENNDLHLMGYFPIAENYRDNNTVRSAVNFTVLDFLQYQIIVNESRSMIQQLIEYLKSYNNSDPNNKMALIAEQFVDVPFIESGALGEGDWQPTSAIYQPGAAHVKQDPVYRLDGLNCQTFIQIVMALFYSSTLDDFDKTILKINYGAAENPNGEFVHYFNRNNFIDGDWNPVNQKNGYLMDVTSSGGLGSFSKVIEAEIYRSHWFLRQAEDLHTVRVLNMDFGDDMVQRYSTVYTALNFPNFDKEIVSTHYIPKTAFVLKQPNGKYIPNEMLFDKIPTPAVVEIVRDPKLWTLDGKNIKDAIGSELSISHMGLVYKKRFKKGDLIYNKISCASDKKKVKNCSVTQVACAEKTCTKLMFVHASNAWPNEYYWYKKSSKQYACTPTLPRNISNFTSCNRVQEQPLFDYLTDYQYGSYRIMDNQSILGIHIEKIGPNL